MFGYTGYKKSGFTLAEVLITLGVVGVVAAMTIPTLNMSHQKKLIETKLKKSFAVATSACEQMLIQENVYETYQTELYSKITTSSSTASQVNSTLRKYFNMTKDSALSSSGWSINLPDDTLLYISLSGHSFLFRAVPNKKQPSSVYEIKLTTKCAYDPNLSTTAAQAFKTVINNDWKLP